MRHFKITVTFGLLALVGPLSALADSAFPVDEAVMVSREIDPQEQAQTYRATYLSSGGFAVTSSEYIDAVGISFDLGSTVSVAQATLRLPIIEYYSLAGSVPIKIYAFADDGAIDLYDYKAGFSVPVGSVEAIGRAELVLDVTGAVNGILQSSQYAGFRIVTGWTPQEITGTTFPAFKGARFDSMASRLEFTPGSAPSSGMDASSFDGFRLSLPGISVDELGVVDATFELTDLDSSIFTLTAAELFPIQSGSTGPVSGTDLLNCSAFNPPSIPSITGDPASFSYSSGLLHAPNVSFQGQQWDMVFTLVDDSPSIRFRLVSLELSPPTPPLNTVASLGGTAIIEPSQDFIPLCHGWVLIGDSSRNRLVERNVITGETASSYSFNTQPDQLTLDDESGIVYFSTHPETERLYKLDLKSGIISYNRIIEGERQFSPIDIVPGEDGNLFVLLHDRSTGESPAANGLWMGILDSSADPVVPSLPLDSPIRVVYDRNQQRVFVTTESNLATFLFFPQSNEFAFVNDTDIPVGSGCTDFAVSPDGKRLAYACPNGNNEEVTPFAIHDLDPVDYHNPDGEWYLGSSPVSATFNAAGDVLIATDGSQLFFFDVVTHLLLEKYDLGLSAGDAVRKIRLSRDGNLLLVFMQNELDSANGKMLWMPMPDIEATTLP
ncbi:MAG: hypothetical protein KDI29_10640 [Pseudomonadales bacterium]|nr:hypothetical protein [Pseudomonadales bacterium]